MKKMKKLHKVLILLLLAAPIFFIGCQKTDLIDESVQTPTDEFIENKDYCGNPLTFTLHNSLYSTYYGVITIANDESNLIFDFDIDDGNDWYIQKTAIFAINDGVTPPETTIGTWYPDNTTQIQHWLLPFQTSNLNTKEHQEIITFGELEYEGINLNECLDIVAGAEIYDSVSGYVRWVFAKPSLKCDGWYVDYCLEPCQIPSCETAYAFEGDPDDCFLSLNTQSNNWGWSNGGIDEGTYEWDIYAGAGQCDITVGTLVGTLNIVYSGGVATITYNIDDAYTLDETHLHIGESEAERLPLNKKDKFITAPGKFDYSGGSSFVIPNLSGPIWVTAHAVVCGNF